MKNIAIITGASSGLGRAYALKFIKDCKDLDEIWVIARRTKKLDELAALDSRVVGITLDLSLSKSFEYLAQRFSQKTYNIKYLINCAGVEYNGSFRMMTKEKIDYLIDLNIKATTKMISTCQIYFAKGTNVINISSITGFLPIAGLAVYSASKSYISFLTRALREESKINHKGINYLCVYPGNMNTEMNKKDDPSHSKIVQRLPWLNIDKIINKSLELVKKGKANYTPGLFYKNFRLIAKILPNAWLIPLFKVKL